MDQKNVRGILALMGVTAISFAVILGTKYFSRQESSESQSESTSYTEELMEVQGEGIRQAVRLKDTQGQVQGYVVTVSSKGYGGDILMDVKFSSNREKITGLTVVEQQETEGVGSKITEEEFLKQFRDIAAPVTMAGLELMDESQGQDSSASEEDGSDNGQEGTDETEELLQKGALKDGEYTAQEKNGDYTSIVNLTVKDGKITQIQWDETDQEGNGKRVLSEKGEYVMTEEGLTWKEQADALAQAVLKEQSLSMLRPDDQGKIDTVAGVSISVGSFIELVRQGIYEAAGVEKPGKVQDTETVQDAGTVQDSGSGQATYQENAGQSGTAVDTVSGATISSTAAARGVNKAYEYLKGAEA